MKVVSFRVNGVKHVIIIIDEQLYHIRIIFLIAKLLSKINVNIKKNLSACATMHTTTLETQVLLIYIFISVIYIYPVKIEGKLC